MATPVAGAAMKQGHLESWIVVQKQQGSWAQNRRKNGSLTDKLTKGRTDWLTEFSAGLLSFSCPWPKRSIGGQNYCLHPQLLAPWRNHIFYNSHRFDQRCAKAKERVKIWKTVETVNIWNRSWWVYRSWVYCSRRFSLGCKLVFIEPWWKRKRSQRRPEKRETESNLIISFFSFCVLVRVRVCVRSR